MATESIIRTTCDACEAKSEKDTGGLPFDWAKLTIIVRKEDDDRWEEFPEEYELCPNCWGAVEGILLVKEAK